MPNAARNATPVGVERTSMSSSADSREFKKCSARPKHPKLTAPT
eukprot:CAMPEP_0196720190 /NCGR_PEP_ID=MMETSP1091-20130531/3024_1 /TAXON_ID=302021 /ORGANISM="Rhodomonas sp., Strain CCMP768" /LENGTH=43 /DNA_ID= /DNA_START= /DNA_END= /DNA_ORIENTATION=